MDSEGDQYFDSLINLNDKKGIFIDGGAYHGENTDELFRRFPKTKMKSVCIEADEENVLYLSQKYANSNKIEVKYAALGRKNGLVYFHNSGARGGQVADIAEAPEESAIPAIGIDDEFFQNEKVVDFIKLDVEGSECDCLSGAEKIIKRDKPILAVCIYHSIEEHWKIPFMIREIRDDYQFFVRHYHYTGIETVLYAI